MVELIPAVNGIFSSSASESKLIIWNTETKSFSVPNWDIATEDALQYYLFNTAGILQASGNTVIGESTSINVQKGFYILIITDGKKRYSKKIVY